MPKKKINNNGGLISKLVMNEITKKKNSLLLSEIQNGEQIILPSFIMNLDDDNNKEIPEFPETNELIKGNDSIKSSNSIQTMDSIKSTDSVKSSVSIDSTNSTNLKLKINNSPNSLITSIVNHKIKKKAETKNITEEPIVDVSPINLSPISNDSELITDAETIIPLEKSISGKKINNGENYNNPVESPYHITEDDFIILSNLTLLSKILPNQKLCITSITEFNSKLGKINFEIKIDDSYIPNLSRWFYNQGRNETIGALSELIQVSIEQLEIYEQSNDKINISKYMNLLTKSKIGLNNLKLTYESDNIITSNIDKMIEKIDKIIK